MNISYNEARTPGLGSASSFTASVHTSRIRADVSADMRFVMQKVHTDCVVVIGDLRKLSLETAADWES